jgi:hypothetical protein
MARNNWFIIRFVRGFDLRVAAARAISHIELAAANGSQDMTAAADLRAFFLACADACGAVMGDDGDDTRSVGRN